jgi:DNA primase large subunit
MIFGADEIDIPSAWDLIREFWVAGALFAFATLWLRGKIERKASADDRIAEVKEAAKREILAAEKERDRALAQMNEFKNLAFAQNVELVRAQGLASEATILAFRKPGDAS